LANFKKLATVFGASVSKNSIFITPFAVCISALDMFNKLAYENSVKKLK
jgi:hypothetical protein